jgi:hypothetical protein
LNQQNSIDENIEDEFEDTFDETDTEDLKCEEEQNGPFGFPIQPPIRTTSPLQRQSLLTLRSGLKTSQEVYGFDWDRKSHEADMHKYMKYVQLSDQVIGRKHQPNDGSLRSFSKLAPIYEFTPTFYTYDSVFNVCLVLKAYYY